MQQYLCFARKVPSTIFGFMYISLPSDQWSRDPSALAVEFSEFSSAFISPPPDASVFVFFLTCNVEATAEADMDLLPEANIFVADGRPTAAHQQTTIALISLKEDEAGWLKGLL